MNRLEQLEHLNRFLLAEMPECREQAERFPREAGPQRRLLRSLMNVRPPRPLDRAFLTAQDELLSAERAEKGVVDGTALPAIATHPKIALWQGDITRLRAGEDHGGL